MVGAFAGYSSLLPDKCTLVGYNTGGSGVMTADADGTVAVGMNALGNLTSGSHCVAVGFESSEDNTTGYKNTALGWSSFYTNQTGYSNTAIGAEAL